jgi:hypothetical protein
MELILSLIGTITGVIALMATIVIQFRYEKLSVEQERKNERMIAEQERKNDERIAEQERKSAERERLLFLSNVIFDSSIPRESRQPFYDEYIGKGGNGTVIKFWLLEGEKEKKTLEK